MSGDSGINEPRTGNPAKSGETDLDDYLGGKSRVSKAYRVLGDDGPPSELDARILAEAERAAKVRPLSTAARNRRWTVPLGIAATIMLSFSLVMNMTSEIERPRPVRSNSADLARRDVMSDEGKAPAPADTRMAAELDADSSDMLREIDEPKTEMAARMHPESSAPHSEPRSKTSLNVPMAAPATPSLLEPMIDTIRGYLLAETKGRVSGATNLLAEAEIPADRAGQSSSLATASKKDQYTTPDGRLEEILALYDSNRSDAARAAIWNFRDEYPDHPVSVLFLERGY